MFATLAKVIPLDLVATISPVLFGLVIYLLSKKGRPRVSALAVLLGALLVGIGITIAGFYIGNIPATAPKHALITAIVDLILGVLFIIYGFKKLLVNKPTKTEHKNRGGGLLKWFLAGVLISIVNDSFFLIFASAKEVGSSGFGSWVKLIFLIINVFFFTLPITLPILIEIIIPKLADKILAKINRFLINCGDFIVFILFMVFGIYFAIKGLCFLIK